jgi:malonyl-CoA O-methyltransferase
LTRLANKAGNVNTMNTDANRAMLRTVDVQRRFDRAAATFDTADVAHRVAREGLMARLQPMRVDPRIAVDLGCATGTACRPLARHFRRAHIVAIDLSRQMLERAAQKKPWLSKTTAMQADAAALPLADHSVDLVFANLLLPWFDAPSVVFNEVSRVLRQDGLFLFSTLGPDSMLELRHAWRQVDAGEHVNRFADMHDIGDAAVRAGLRDPVLDVDRLTVTYPGAAELFHDLSAVGARNSLAARTRSLVGRNRFRAMTDMLEATRRDGVIPVELELVYGHCWGPGPSATKGEYHVDAGHIGRRR